MNKTNMKKLISFLKKAPRKDFNMVRLFNTDCPSCIAGYAAVLSEGGQIHIKKEDCVTGLAEEFLGLTEIEGKQLFMPNLPEFNFSWVIPNQITKEHAINCLQNCIETDKVNWNDTKPITSIPL